MVLQIFDAVFTLIAVRGGATELNPLMRIALESGPAVFFASKAFLCMAGTIALYRVRAIKSLVGACLVYALVVLYHVVNLFQG